MRFSVGLFCLQSTAMAPRHHVHAYRELREDAQLIERLGFDGIWLSEHHFFYDGYCPSLLPAAASALAVTERLRVGTGMLLLPMQGTARVVEAAADLHQRSNGRFDLGLGLGYRDVEFDGKGSPRQLRVQRLQGALAELGALGDGAPPVWIGSATRDGNFRAGAAGHGVFLSGAHLLPKVRDLIAAHREGWGSTGRPGPAPPAAALRNFWVVSDERQKAAVLDWVRASYILYAGLGWAVAAEGENEAMDFKQKSDEAVSMAVASAVVGSPAEVIAAIEDLRAAGGDLCSFRVVLEGSDRGAFHEVLHRLAGEVMPHFAAVPA
jgi:alkanesulfonate monooxygenase SsuD/methylene tetrahydromethanopterin reductase-like flavin-dependent oxidoreductase (luciferase family)